jgi:diaminopimelate epimerase
MGNSFTFYKYQGTGNDFIMIDHMRTEPTYFTIDQIKGMCDRRFGIGADGLIILTPSSDYDFLMDYYNSDGNASTMCGNGGRCIVRFAYDLGYISSMTTFEAVDGLHSAEIIEDLVSLHMIDVDNILVDNDGAYIINTGSPHYVKFIQDGAGLAKIVEFGKQIRYSDKYINEGINVNLIHEKGDNSIAMATYERGVEDETFSCGTGVTAASLALAHKTNINSEIIVDTKGGRLSVSFDRINDNFSNIVLKGPAKMVFKGTINL